MSSKSQPASKHQTTPPTKTPATSPLKPGVISVAWAKRRWISWTVYLVATVAVIGGGFGAWAYWSQAAGMVKNTTIAGRNFSGSSSMAALDELQHQWSEFSKQAFIFSADGTTTAINVVAGSTSETELDVQVAAFDIQKSIDDAYAFGHEGPWLTQLRERVSGALGRRHEFGRFAIDTESIMMTLRQRLAAKETPAQSAGMKAAAADHVTVTESSNGRSFDYPATGRAVERHLRSLDTRVITVPAITVAPAVKFSANLQAVADQEAPALLARAPFSLTFNDRTWTINADTLITLIGFRQSGKAIHIGFDEGKTATYLQTLAPEIEVAPQDARFSIVGNKVKEFQTSVTGRSIDAIATTDQMERNLIDQNLTTSPIAIREQPPTSETVGTNNLGITELVAEGRTSFKGSPVNRKYNLSLGSEKLNGLLIPPGETFSLVEALGPIDGAHGWKPELVIKPGARITPEFGGGLCQVATTLFRAALNTGLEIVERRNHSLRISYYEPPIGLDATIYEPRPDFRFKNNYEQYLLLQTEVAGTDLIYRFYGTKDGRSVDIPIPKVYNRTAIPKTKTIEVVDLKPGETKCQTPGHPGADATATYTVTRADGTKVTQVFQSHYTAVGVVCRVGKKAAAKTE